MANAKRGLIKQCAEWQEFEDKRVDLIPHNTRGIYVLYQKRAAGTYDVMYIGMAAGPEAGVRGRLKKHLQSETKSLCTHFSVFEVYKDVDEDLVEELEGILRHVFRKDTDANLLGKQRGYGKLRNARENDFTKWH